METTRPSRLPLVVIGAVVAIAVAIAFGLGLRGPREYEPGTPEAALQAFLDAGLDGDQDAVLALLAVDDRGRCQAELDRYGSWDGSDGMGFALDEMVVEGSRARAKVTQRYTDSGDPFAGAPRTSTHVYELTSADEGWLIDRASWPWWIDQCTGGPR